MYGNEIFLLIIEKGIIPTMENRLHEEQSGFRKEGNIQD